MVEWVDSHSGEGWQPLEAIADAGIPVYCRSVGWLISQANGTTVLVAHLSGEKNGNLRLFGKGDIAIPNRAITRIRRLRG